MNEWLNVDLDVTLALVICVWIVVAGFTLALCLYRPDKIAYFKKSEEDHDLFI